MRRLPSVVPLVVLPLVSGCASATTADRVTRIITTDELTANRILGQAYACGYPGVNKALGAGAEATVAIPLPLEADPHYECLTSALTARSQDVAAAKAQ